MEYLGLNDKDSIVSKSDVHEHLNKISDRVKQHRRNVHENQLPDLEEIAFVNNKVKYVNGNITLSTNISYPQVYLGLGNYKIVITAKSQTSVRNLKLIVNLQRVTSPSSNISVINVPLTTEFQTYEYDFTVDRLGTYKVLPRPSTSTAVLEISNLELRRVY